jgi:hypothetical protein
MKNHTMAFSGVEKSTGKKVGRIKHVYVSGSVKSSKEYVSAASFLKPKAKAGEGCFSATAENLDKLVTSSMAAFEKYKATGKISGWTRVD